MGNVTGDRVTAIMPHSCSVIGVYPCRACLACDPPLACLMYNRLAITLIWPLTLPSTLNVDTNVKQEVMSMEAF